MKVISSVRTSIDHFQIGWLKFLPEVRSNAILCIHNLFKYSFVDEGVHEYRPQHHNILGSVSGGFQGGSGNKGGIIPPQGFVKFGIGPNFAHNLLRN